MRVMVLSSDRRFREVTSMLLTRRGCEVSIADGTRALRESIDATHADVLVIDAGQSLASAARVSAAVESLSQPVGIVVVDDRPEPILPRLEALPKWGSFDLLFAAVEQAHAKPRRPGLLGYRGAGAASASGASS